MHINDLKGLVTPICSIAIDAGKAINRYYKKQIEITIKDDKSPLTKADLESNKIIIDSLKKINNRIPILSEESCVDWSTRKNWETYWLVDPLDGTKEFINKNGEFTVNIALIHNNRPILGVIYAPVFSTLYFAYKNGGSYKLEINREDSKKFFFDHSLKLSVSTESKKDLTKVICSRSHPNEEFTVWLKNNVNQYQIVQKGSSLKFCYLAEAKADLYPRLRPTCEWDIAAGHIILTEAGGKIQTLENKEILYNLKKDIKNPYFIASN